MPKQSVIKLRNYFSNRKEATKRKTTTYQKVSKIGILIQAKEIKNSTAINTFVTGLKSDGKKVSVLCFSENNISIPFEFDFDQFTIKDIAWNGKIAKASVNLFTEQSFDYLICLAIDINPALTSVLLQSKALCRTGLQTLISESLLDLMIYTNNNEITPEEIGSQILELVQKIKTND